MKTAKHKEPKMVAYRREPGSPLTAKQKANLEELARMPEHEIDTSDIPEWTDEMWKRAVRGRFYRPVKKAVSLRLDADVIASLKKDGQGYQMQTNQMLRERMLKSWRVIFTPVSRLAGHPDSWGGWRRAIFCRFGCAQGRAVRIWFRGFMALLQK